MDATSILDTVRSREVDRDFVKQAHLDVTSRQRTNALPWRGQFTPGLPATLIEALAPTGTLLDPFVGSGTSLAEAMRVGLPSVGAEVNPAALSLASVYELAGHDSDTRESAMKQCERLLQDAVMRSTDGLLADGIEPHRAVLDGLRDVESDSTSKLVVATLMLAMGNGKQTTPEKLVKSWAQVRGLIESLPTSPISTSVLPSDARAVPLDSGSVGMVLTSPPYINVFNYHQNYRPTMEMLGWDILPAARSEIGSNRKHRGNRFLTVVQYCIDMAATLDEMARVATPGAPVVFVVGRESKVRGMAFPNGDLLAGLVEASPTLEFARWQERSFVSRFAGRIYEEILTFRRVDGEQGISTSTARALGVRVLEEAQSIADEGEVRRQIDDAISSSDRILASPPLALRRFSSPTQ